MSGQEAWGRLGWQGISLDVPEDWCPGRLEGDRGNGYLRVEDETHARLELRWETLGRSAPPASALVDNYLRQTRKKLPRGAPEPRVERGRTIRELAGLDHEAFTWRGGFNAHSVLLVAPESRRLVHVRVFFEEGKDDRSLARRIFGSLRVAPRDGMEEWALFGLSFQAPQAWRLEHSSLQTGRLEFLFRAGNDELEVIRHSLAELTLRKGSLEQWLRTTLAKGLRGYNVTARAADYRGHPAVRCEGVQSLKVRPLSLFARRRHLTALAWHCASSDKILAVRCTTATAGDHLAERCAGSIACH